MDDLIAISKTNIILELENFASIYFLGFRNLLSKILVIVVLKRARTPLKGVLKECHSIFNGGLGAGVPLNLLAVSGSGSATQKIKEC